MTVKMSVLHCLMMSYGGELLAQYQGLLKTHHEYVQSADSRLRSFQERCAAFQGLESQVSVFQKQVANLNEKLSSFDVAFVNAKANGKEQNKKIKSLTKNLNQLNVEGRLAEASPLMAMTDYLFLRRFLIDTRVSPPVAKESTVTPVSSSLELPLNDVPFSYAAALGQNEEWGVSHIVGEDVGSPLAQGPKRVSFGPNDVVVAFSVEEKGNGSPSPPSAAEEDVASPSRV
ncbi:hypothetical protein Tco_0475089 [Tanacetum coccineum]